LYSWVKAFIRFVDQGIDIDGGKNGTTGVSDECDDIEKGACIAAKK